MNDYRLVAARRLVWTPDAWREPARLGLAIRGLKEVIAEWPDNAQNHIEAKMLISKLYAAGKTPIQ